MSRRQGKRARKAWHIADGYGARCWLDYTGEDRVCLAVDYREGDEEESEASIMLTPDTARSLSRQLERFAQAAEFLGSLNPPDEVEP